MADVFVSYARPTSAQQVAEALRATGYQVWRDDELPAHRAYAEVIEERLKSAKAVVVLWSAEAAKSQWVRAEADAAREGHARPGDARRGEYLRCRSIKSSVPTSRAGTATTTAPGWRKLARQRAALVRGSKTTSPSAAAARSAQLSICVLPFANMSGDAEQEYFSDGISEDIITDLSQVSALGVVARNTAFTFKGKRWTSATSPASSTSAMCSKAACARPAAGCGSPPS